MQRVAAGLAGFGWYFFIGGWPTLNPFNVSWLQHDWMQHWLGFLFFKEEAWTFPLGRLASMPYPIGTSIGFTDSNPLVALAVKPFADLLPSEFQLIGWWLLLSFGLQGYFGALLCSTVTRDPWQQAAGGALFVLSPVLAMRLGHDTLCAQWLVLAQLYLGLRRFDPVVASENTRASPAFARQTGVWSVVVVCVAASIHPYLAAMCLVMALASLMRLQFAGLLRVPMVAAFAGVMLAGVAVLFWLIGYFGPERSALIGFGSYSADVLTLFDSRGSSRLVPAMPTLWGQGEGVAFLGLGGLIAVGVGVWCVLRKRRVEWQHRQIVVGAALVLAVYALSSDISVAGRVVAQVRTLYGAFDSLTSTFRASGRFIWPMHYLLLLFGVWGLARLVPGGRRFAGASLLAAVLVIQALDFRIDSSWSSDKNLRQVRAAEFELARGRYRHAALYPAQVGSDCGAWDEEHVFRYALLAYRLGLTYNSGSFARIAHNDVRRQCSALVSQVEAGEFDTQTVYVVAPESVALFRTRNATCGAIDGDWICVSPQGDPAFRTRLATGGRQ